MKRYVHIYCGDGKGKTTAALGLGIRAAGSGMKVLIARFLKSDSSSELAVLNAIENITVMPCEKQFGFFWNMTDEQKKEAKIYYTELFRKIIKEIQDKHYDMIIMDEIMATVAHDFINEEELLLFLQNRDRGLEIVLTGRNPSDSLINAADYVSEIQKRKHPFDQGVPARKGIEM